MKPTDIAGYRDLSEADVLYINEIKACEVEIGGLWRQLRDEANPDPRWLAVAKTHFQEGFTALVRAIAKPEDVF